MHITVMKATKDVVLLYDIKVGVYLIYRAYILKEVNLFRHHITLSFFEKLKVPFLM